ncbi:hypothetical protein ACHAWU_006148 [Discostella pseudostelligera]|uniref:Uncharacterized protein n=1 Tax=Discostella pseudostelligera TaxID=259834 RepID=A0ABD3M1G2_9STRA
MDQNNNIAEQVLGMARASLADCILRLARYKLGHAVVGDHGEMVIHIFGIMNGLLHRDHALMRQWTDMIFALSSTPVRDKGCINLCLERVVEDGIVRDNLLDAFKTLHRPRLLLKTTMHGAKFATKALKANSSVQSLGIDGTNTTPFKSEKTATALVAAVIKHPSLDIIAIENCNLGRNKPVLSAIIPAVLSNISYIKLDGNVIDSYGATLIANCLAQNPSVKNLSLSNNALVDRDAYKLAASLKTNTTLRNLALEGNNITHAGLKAFFFLVHGDGLNSINDANHHCFIDLLADSEVNAFNDPILNRRVKIFSTIMYDVGCLGDAVPFELVPRLLIILQGREITEDGEPVFNPLNLVFQYVREFNTTLFNQSGMDRDESRSVDDISTGLGCAQLAD